MPMGNEDTFGNWQPPITHYQGVVLFTTFLSGFRPSRRLCSNSFTETKRAGNYPRKVPTTKPSTQKCILVLDKRTKCFTK